MGLGNFSLKSYNTFGIDAYADNFIEITTEDQLIEYLKTNKDFFVLGGGSNIVLTQNIEKDVLYINNKGVSVIEEDDISLLIKAETNINFKRLTPAFSIELNNFYKDDVRKSS